jgi:hypothetical protein
MTNNLLMKALYIATVLSAMSAMATFGAPSIDIPDSSNTGLLLGLVIACLALVRRKVR